MTKQTETFINPIDPDKVAENPGLLPYPHNVGSPAFTPTKSGAIKSASMKAMQEQGDMQLKQIREQIELLARQADEILQRINVSKAVYAAEMNFQPVPGSTYHLYAREEGLFVLSMIGPDEWLRKIPYKYFVATVKLLADHTWSVEKKG